MATTEETKFSIWALIYKHSSNIARLCMFFGSAFQMWVALQYTNDSWWMLLGIFWFCILPFVHTLFMLTDALMDPKKHNFSGFSGIATFGTLIAIFVVGYLLRDDQKLQNILGIVAPLAAMLASQLTHYMMDSWHGHQHEPVFTGADLVRSVAWVPSIAGSAVVHTYRMIKPTKWNTNANLPLMSKDRPKKKPVKKVGESDISLKSEPKIESEFNAPLISEEIKKPVEKIEPSISKKPEKAKERPFVAPADYKNSTWPGKNKEKN